MIGVGRRSLVYVGHRGVRGPLAGEIVYGHGGVESEVQPRFGGDADLFSLGSGLDGGASARADGCAFAASSEPAD